MVSTSMPSRADASTTSRTELMPARWPSTRGRWRLAAQRPLPSMMIATCAGSCSKFTCKASASSGEPGGNHASSWSSDIRASTENQTAILAVVDRHQPEPAGRRGGPRAGAREAVADGGNVGGRATPQADVQERACHGAHHVPEESVGRYLEHQQAGARDRGLRNRRGWRRLPRLPDADVGVRHGPHGVRHGAAGGLEGAEVVCPTKRADRLAHRADVERSRDSVGVATQEGTGDFALEGQVPVCLAARREARVKIGRRLLNTGDANRGGQLGVQRAGNRRRVVGSLHPGARHLRHRVHARVGPSRAVHRDVRAVDARERVLKQPLHRVAGLLALPPGQLCPVVLDRQLERAQTGSGLQASDYGLLVLAELKFGPKHGHRQFLDPGFTTGTPCAQSGHAAGSYVGRVMRSSAWKGTPRSTESPLRSTIAAAATTVAPAARATSIVSRVESPVVTTSSTTMTLSSGPNVKPRRSVSRLSCRSAKIARTPSARATSWPMTMPPSAGERTAVAP